MPPNMVGMPNALPAQLAEGQRVTTPKGAGCVLNVAGGRARVQHDGGLTSWVEFKDLSLVSDAEQAHGASPPPAPPTAMAPRPPPPYTNASGEMGPNGATFVVQLIQSGKASLTHHWGSTLANESGTSVYSGMPDGRIRCTSSGWCFGHPTPEQV